MMRFLPALRAVLFMEQGMTPEAACKAALAPISAAYPHASGAMVCVASDGRFGAARFGFASFPFAVRAEGMDDVAVFTV
jgi:hypothetical protein